jgi:predicted transcriptional regulator YheO
LKEKAFILQTLKQLADAIVDIFGRHCEVVIHDLTTLTDLSHSLIHVAGDVTHRKPGAPITNVVVKALHEEGDEVKDQYNYKTTTRDGHTLKSSNIYIRNSRGKVIGALCVNFDITEFLNSVSLLQSFIRTEDSDTSLKRETFASSANETLDTLIEQAVAEMGKQPSAMATAERITFIELLEHNGTFHMKGAVDYVARLMGVTKFTVYRYLQDIRSGR